MSPWWADSDRLDVLVVKSTKTRCLLVLIDHSKITLQDYCLNFRTSDTVWSSTFHTWWHTTSTQTGGIGKKKGEPLGVCPNEEVRLKDRTLLPQTLVQSLIDTGTGRGHLVVGTLSRFYDPSPVPSHLPRTGLLSNGITTLRDRTHGINLKVERPNSGPGTRGENSSMNGEGRRGDLGTSNR